MDKEKEVKSDATVKIATKIKRVGGKLIVTRITKTISKLGKPITRKLRRKKQRKSKRR